MSWSIPAAGLVAAAFVLARAAVRHRSRELAIARVGPTRGSGPRVPSRRLELLGRRGLRSPLVAILGLGVGSVIAGPPGGLAGFAAALAVPVWLRRRQAAKATALMEGQLAEAVVSIAAGMRAGLSLSQAIRFAAAEAEPPLSVDLREAADREQLGIPLAVTLEEWATEAASEDVRLVGGVLQLHRRTGGDLPAVLDQLARTLRDRRSAAREIRGYTAQARLSGAILGLLPIGFFLFLSVTSRRDIALAYRSPVGQTAIAVGLALEGLAFVWIRRLLRVT